MLWKQKRSYLFKKGYGRSKGTRLDPVAQPPPGGAPAVHAVPPATVLAFAPLSAISIAPLLPPAPILSQHPLVSSVSRVPNLPSDSVAPPLPTVHRSVPNRVPSPSESICSSDGELSPRFIVRNRTNGPDKRLLSPTRGERIQIKADLGRTSDLTWRFANTLYQTDAPDENAGMPPTSVYLFVSLDADNIIRDVSKSPNPSFKWAKHIRSTPL